MSQRTSPLRGIALSSILLFATACAVDTATYSSALTGEECEPNETLVPLPGPGPGPGNGNGNTSPTGIPGDNLDDLRSGKVDCLGDGNSGQGDDKKHGCEIPPGCDDELCCDDSVLPPEDDDDVDDGADDGSDDGSDDGADDGSDDGSDDGADDGSDDGADTCEAVCQVDTDCGTEQACDADGCCVASID